MGIVVEVKALAANSLVPTTLEPFITTAVASEPWFAKSVSVKSGVVTMPVNVGPAIAAFAAKAFVTVVA